MLEIIDMIFNNVKNILLASLLIAPNVVVAGELLTMRATPAIIQRNTAHFIVLPTFLIGGAIALNIARGKKILPKIFPMEFRHIQARHENLKRLEDLTNFIKNGGHDEDPSEYLQYRRYHNVTMTDKNFEERGGYIGYAAHIKKDIEDNAPNLQPTYFQKILVFLQGGNGDEPAKSIIPDKTTLTALGASGLLIGKKIDDSAAKTNMAKFTQYFDAIQGTAATFDGMRRLLNIPPKISIPNCNVADTLNKFL
jgi:hypothetical protein